MPTKRKRIYEPKEAMAQRLAEFIEDCIAESTLEECRRMTVVEINGHLRDLGLQTHMKMELNTEEYNGGHTFVVLNVWGKAMEGR